MATSFTRLDVEDVLSSIRKLVSDTGPGLSGGGSSVPPLLLLTPAHRVVEDTSRMTLTPPVSEPAADADEVGTLHGETGDAGPLHLGTPVFVRAKDEMPDGDPQTDDVAAISDADQLAVEPVEAVEETPAPLIIGIDAAELEAEAAGDGPTLEDAIEPSDIDGQGGASDEMDDPFQEAFANTGSLEMRAAEFEIALSQENEDWEPDGSEREPQGFPELAFLAKYRERSVILEDQVDPNSKMDTGQISAFVTEALANETKTAADEGATEKADTDVTLEADADFEIAVTASDASDAEHVEEPILSVDEQPLDAPEPAEPMEPEIELSDAEAIDHILRVVPSVDEDVAASSDAEAEDSDQEDGALDEADIADIVVNLAETQESTDAPESDEHAVTAILAEQDADAQKAVESLTTPTHADAHNTPLVIEFQDDEEGFDEPEVWSSDDELLVDEEVLRRVVADIVRDELQGRLGERITRNVRKMVRREIERALSTKHLE